MDRNAANALISALATSTSPANVNGINKLNLNEGIQSLILALDNADTASNQVEDADIRNLWRVQLATLRLLLTR